MDKVGMNQRAKAGVKQVKDVMGVHWAEIDFHHLLGVHHLHGHRVVKNVSLLCVHQQEVDCLKKEFGQLPGQ
jgi:hypothetical protein